ncbi:hypothetical protein G8O24_03285 [Bradyrhizobium sp. INPA01-394B]|uniref:Uncharacterized protein n=1 Tax=Bradyrhizobium campsiandrae TaxID=1729892 RepID=A0ABR7U801_9BRAD|nr:hypothetical protein [Bradyrhizobium campsiandrae]MBC9876367.1 hypothetical protein [Bradyrhizobium campsiandrae]MBC9980110.1 hypothetical protein [Bradyrhizobium campsiandrae]
MSRKMPGVLSVPVSSQSEPMPRSPGWARWMAEALAYRAEPEGAKKIAGAEAPVRRDPAPVRVLRRVSPRP